MMSPIAVVKLHHSPSTTPSWSQLRFILSVCTHTVPSDNGVFYPSTRNFRQVRHLSRSHPRWHNRVLHDDPVHATARVRNAHGNDLPRRTQRLGTMGLRVWQQRHADLLRSAVGAGHAKVSYQYQDRAIPDGFGGGRVPLWVQHRGNGKGPVFESVP